MAEITGVLERSWRRTCTVEGRHSRWFWSSGAEAVDRSVSEFVGGPTLVLPESTKRAYRERTLTLFCGGFYTDTSRDSLRLVRREPGSFRRSPHSSGSDLPPQAITIRGQSYPAPLFNVQLLKPTTPQMQILWRRAISSIMPSTTLDAQGQRWFPHDSFDWVHRNYVIDWSVSSLYAMEM